MPLVAHLVDQAFTDRTRRRKTHRCSSAQDEATVYTCPRSSVDSEDGDSLVKSLEPVQECRQCSIDVSHAGPGHEEVGHRLLVERLRLRCSPRRPHLVGCTVRIIK